MTTLFLEGILLGLLVAISLGPAFFAIIQTGINKSFKHGVFMAVGITISDIILVAISYLIGAKLFDDPQNKVYVGLIGGIILIIFGSVSWAKKPDILKRRNVNYQAPTDVPLFLYIFRGFFLNIVNPFLFFFWFGALGYVGKDAAEGEMLKSTIIFFSGTFLMIFAGDILKSYIGGKIKGFLRPRKEIILNKIVGIALVIFGVVLIFRTLSGIGFFEQLKDNLKLKKTEAKYQVISKGNIVKLTLYKDSTLAIKTVIDNKTSRSTGDWYYIDSTNAVFEVAITKSDIDSLELPEKRRYQLTVNGVVRMDDSLLFNYSPMDFKPLEEFKIQKLSQANLNLPNNSLGDSCQTWSLNEQQLTKIIKESELIDVGIWNYQFDFLPCVMNAQIVQEGKTYFIQMNAGAWLEIRVQDSSIYYGSYKAENAGFFLSLPHIEEN